MNPATEEHRRIGALLAQYHGYNPGELLLETRSLPGGLEAYSIQRVTARYHDRRGRARAVSLVVKRVRGPAVREAWVYQRLVTPHLSELSPRLLAVDQTHPEEATLYLEAIRPVHRWPWSDSILAGQVLERLAGMHAGAVGRKAARELELWDYETELERSASMTLELLERSRWHPGLASLRQRLPATRRVVDALPVLRRQVFAFSPFGRKPVHGDVHPGNILLRRRRGGLEPALLDWGRARMGSPLEDVVSWLQSLGYWEPEARRRHDTLLARYLSAWGTDPRPTPAFRAAYWVAGASNALAGALRHYLALAQDDSKPESRRLGAANAARDWLRVIRRADAYTK